METPRNEIAIRESEDFPRSLIANKRSETAILSTRAVDIDLSITIKIKKFNYLTDSI